MSRIVYRLRVEGTEYDLEGANYDEWFGTLREAKARRDKHIENHTWEDHPTGQDLALRCLNQAGFVEHWETVVPPIVKGE